MNLKKIFHSRFYPLILVFSYLFLMGVDIFVLDHFSKGKITEVLKIWIPWGLKVNFFLILTAVLFCCQDIAGWIRNFFNRKGLLLAALLSLSFSMCFFAAPRTHRIYYDEDIYANVAQNMALSNQTGYCNYGTFEYGEYFPHWISYNKEPSGWPFLISLPFQIFGINELFAFVLNNLLFTLGVLTIFLIPWHLTGNYFISFSAALAYAFIPHNLLWSNTAAAETSAGVLAGVTVLALVVYLKTRQNRHLYLLVLLLPLACQMRPESCMLLPWAMAAGLVVSPQILKDRKVWSLGLLTTLFLLPHVLHFYAVSGHSWGAQGNKFSTEFLYHNLEVNGLYYLTDKTFPLIITIFAALGLFFFRGMLRWRLLMLFWFLPFWGIFLFFYAGSYQYGADVRFALLSFMPLAILAGMGAGWIQKNLLVVRYRTMGIDSIQNSSAARNMTACLVLLLMLFSLLKFLPLTRLLGQEAWGSRYDHKYAQEFIAMIPERSIVLTQNPTMFLLWNQNAIQTHAGINNPGLIKELMKKYQGHVYFHDNYWCNTQNRRNVRLCQDIRDKYDLEAVATASEQHYQYGLYRMKLKGGTAKKSK